MVRISLITCFLLILLRLVIGWHFLFEVRTNDISPQGSPPAEIAKQPFSSAGYFAEAEGPLGPIIREQVGDPDSNLLAKLQLVEAGDDRPSARMPEVLKKQWEDYTNQFNTFYKLSDEETNQTAKVLKDSEK